MLSRNSAIVRLSNFFNRVPGWCIISCGILWKFGVDIVFSSLASEQIGPTHVDNEYFYVFIGVFLAPFIETIIFQFLPIEAFEMISLKVSGKKNPIYAAFFSAILFGCAHSYSLLSVLATCVSGLALSSTYLIFKHRKHSAGYGFIMTMVLHFLVNLIINTLRFLL